MLDALVSQVHETDEPQNLNSKAEFVRGDICDTEVLAGALDGIEAVYHQAAEVGVGQSMYEIQKYVRANDLGTAVLLEALSERRRRFASSSSPRRCRIGEELRLPNLRH